jgi:hypothetical protein
MFVDLPAFAAWRFVDAVDGFEVVYARPGRLRGHTSVVENGQAYAVRYDITMDDHWRTREAASRPTPSPGRARPSSSRTVTAGGRSTAKLRRISTD